MSTIKEKIGRRIRQARTAQGWTQKDLAVKLDLKAQNISDYERGRAQPPSDVVLRLAELFDKSTDWVLYGAPVAVDPFKRLETLIREHIVESNKGKEVNYIMSHLEQANPEDATYPWGYHSRSRVIVSRWKEIVQARGFHLEYVIHSSSGYAFVIEPSCGKTNMISGDKPRHLIFEPDEGFSFLQSCLYMLPSLFKHELLEDVFKNVFNKFSSGLKTDFSVSKEKDFFFGYETNTVEIVFDGKPPYTPSYESKGHGQNDFVDYASLIYAKDSRITELPKMLKQGAVSFDSILAFGGCHRLGSGAMAYLASHPESLQAKLKSTGIVPFKDSFEAVFQIKANTGVPLTEDAISLLDASKLILTN
jgi:transcriptional regulator with XRE-family HTH domain